VPVFEFGVNQGAIPGNLRNVDGDAAGCRGDAARGGA
jgi:hypothetical protein